MRMLSSSLATMAAFLALSGDVTMPHCRITLSDSMPRGLYCETQESLTRGVIVAECLPLELAIFGKERGYLSDGGCPGDVPPILKQVAAVPGDTVELTEEYVAINDVPILGSATLKTDSQGRKLPAIERGTFTLQEGEVFLLATNSERSWDGRYTGAARISDLIGTFKPVWTEGE